MKRIGSLPNIPYSPREIHDSHKVSQRNVDSIMPERVPGAGARRSETEDTPRLARDIEMSPRLSFCLDAILQKIEAAEVSADSRERSLERALDFFSATTRSQTRLLSEMVQNTFRLAEETDRQIRRLSLCMDEFQSRQPWWASRFLEQDNHRQTLSQEIGAQIYSSTLDCCDAIQSLSQKIVGIEAALERNREEEINHLNDIETDMDLMIEEFQQLSEQNESFSRVVTEIRNQMSRRLIGGRTSDTQSSSIGVELLEAWIRA